MRTTVHTLALLLLGTCGWAHAQPGTPEPAPPPSTPSPGVPLQPDWRQVHRHVLQAGQVADLYEAVWLERGRRWHGASLSIDALDAFDPADAVFDATLPGQEGHWVFSDPGDGVPWPTEAVRIVDGSSPDAYAVAVHLYCEDASACASLEADGLALPLPRPANASGNAPDTAYRQWMQQVVKEACELGPLNKPMPRYPDAATANDTSGVATVVLVVNPCGQVRDAWIARSTGDARLDESAVRTLRKWRIEQGSVVARVNVRFVIQDDAMGSDQTPGTSARDAMVGPPGLEPGTKGL